MKCNTCTFNIYWKVWIEISKSRLMTWSDQNPKSWHLKSQISSSIENLFQSKPIKVSRVEFQSGSWLFVGLSADKKDNSCRQYILGEEYRGMLKPLTPIIVAKFGRKKWFDFTIYCENLIAFCPKSCGSLLKIRKLLESTNRILESTITWKSIFFYEKYLTNIYFSINFLNFAKLDPKQLPI